MGSEALPPGTQEAGRSAEAAAESNLALLQAHSSVEKAGLIGGVRLKAIPSDGKFAYASFCAAGSPGERQGSRPDSFLS